MANLPTASDRTIAAPCCRKLQPHSLIGSLSADGWSIGGLPVTLLGEQEAM
jgi:hypothetical protein